jgi:alanine racemase
VVASSAIAEISAAALRGNLRAIRRRLPAGTPLCAAVKADAYGHGLGPVLEVFGQEHVERVAVANLIEALEVRRHGWPRPVLVLGSPLSAASEARRVDRARAILEADLHCTVTTLDEARLLSQQAQRLSRRARIEAKVDTGMGRAGAVLDGAVEWIAQAAGLPGVVMEGVYTHFATADEADPSFAHEQLGRFIGLRDALRAAGVRVGRYHAANSAAIFRLPASHLDLVRPGLALYGYWAGPEDERPADLMPAMRVLAELQAVRRLPAGHSVGYGRAFRTVRSSTLGVVPVGYADGYRRGLGNHAVMVLEPARGRPRTPVPVVGRVSMDQTTVDLTDAGDARVGDRVIVIDDDPAAPNSVESLARTLGTIPYEITCGLGRRIPRVPR